MSITSRKEIGQRGEDIATRYLESKGYNVRERNYQRKIGEIDVIAEKKRKIIFVEVKAIRAKQGFQPEDHLDYKKQHKLIQLSRVYLRQKRLQPTNGWQIDLIALRFNPKEGYSLKHYPNVLADNY